jgi:hypothetical protein
MRINPVTAFVLTAVLFGAGLAVHEKHKDAAPAPVPAPAVHTPGPDFLMPQKAAGALPKPGKGVWYEGYHFDHKTVCIDSSISGAPLADVARMYSGSNKGGLRVVVGGRAGGCKAKGYAVDQRVTFLSMSANGHKYGACAFTSPSYYPSTGNVATMQVDVWVTGPRETLCGNYVSGEWVDVFAHEFGHATGLSHAQPGKLSIMRDGHSLDAGDRKRLTAIYANRRY